MRQGVFFRWAPGFVFFRDFVFLRRIFIFLSNWLNFFHGQNEKPFSAAISTFRSRIQEFKMGFEARTQLFWLLHQIATDLVFGKLRLGAFKRRTNHQNPMRSYGINALQKVARYIVLKNRNRF